MNIFVGNLSYQLHEDELEQLFAQYGEVASAKIINDKFTGRSKGFGFVEMPNDEEANEAITGLNNKDIQGRPLKVNKALPPRQKENRNRW